LANADLIGRSNRVLADAPELRWGAAALVIAAISFNAVLCLINTRVAPIHNSYVVLSEVVIITAALLASFRTMEPRYVVIIAAMIAYIAILSVVRAMVSPGAGLDLKIGRDFLIPIAFLLLGRSENKVKVADYTVYVATALVLVFALFEFFSLDAYLKIFSVTDYYVARGTLDASDPSLQWASGLMVSGLRPEEQGRALLPFLGEHRVSSLFLEPVGLGNFGFIVAIWSIARSKMERRLRLWSIVAGIALIILADSRFNAYFLGVGVVILLANPRITKLVVAALPAVLIIGLCLGAADAAVGDVPLLAGLTLKERLLYSGHVLLDFDILNWLGLEAARAQTFDSGYAYVITNVGIIGLAAFWIWFMTLAGRCRDFYAFRNANAAYFAVLFCISASQFTIKTAALLWFLMGALSVARDPRQVRLGRQPEDVGRRRKTRLQAATLA
jgi:putative polymerase